METKQEFHDPVLKDAVKRCWACDCASEHLRKQVLSLLKDDKLEEKPVRRPGLRGSWILWPLGMAAAILVSVTFFDRFIKPPAISPVATALPVSLETDLIQTHDHCCKLANHQHLPVSKDDDSGIALAFREKLNHAVVMYRPTDAGWTFKGASICPVGSTPSGHLVFARGDDALSIFQLPASMLPKAVNGDTFAATVDQHCIVGFVKDGALFCVVGTGPTGTVSINELQQMSQQMEPKVTFAPEPKPTGVVLTELLRPIR